MLWATVLSCLLVMLVRFLIAAWSRDELPIEAARIASNEALFRAAFALAIEALFLLTAAIIPALAAIEALFLLTAATMPASGLLPIPPPIGSVFPPPGALPTPGKRPLIA